MNPISTSSLLHLFKTRYHINFNYDKKKLIDFTFRKCLPAPVSFTDLGGIWNVDGAYAFYTLQKYKPVHAFLADTDFTEASIIKGQLFPNLKLINGNFGEEEVSQQIGKVDAVFMFDILLHQVKPDWNEILGIYSEHSNYILIYNPQWTASEMTQRLLDLGKEEYFKNVPHSHGDPFYNTLFDKLNDTHPQHKRIWRDIHNVWQWGITDRDLLERMEQLGFGLQWYKNCGRFNSLKNFENHAFVFQKK